MTAVARPACILVVDDQPTRLGLLDTMPTQETS